MVTKINEARDEIRNVLLGVMGGLHVEERVNGDDNSQPDFE